MLIGATHFTARCVEAVRKIPDVSIPGIFTAPETFNISYAPAGVRNAMHANLRLLGSRFKIPVTEMSGKMSDPALLDVVRTHRPDAFLVVGWYHIVPKSYRDIAPAYGLHASLLPDYAGGAPLVWAMINGEPRTGITLFRMDDGVDTGDIVGQAETRILLNDTIASLYARIEEAGIDLLRTHLPRLVTGDATLTPQDPSRRRVFPQRSPKDGMVDWSRPALDVYNFVRAQTHPYPGAFTYLDGRKVSVWEAKLFERPRNNAVPAPRGGEILACIDNGPLRGILVATANGDHSLLVTAADDEQGNKIPLDDGGRAWLGAFSKLRFSGPRVT